MAPKKAAGAPAATGSKKRPHEAPTKGRKVFSGARQKVPTGGGGGAGSNGKTGKAYTEDAGDDDMFESALDDADDGSRRKKDDSSDEDEDEEVKETADEKRLRLAKSYLDKLRAEEEENASEEEEEEEDPHGNNVRNLDSHDRLADRLKNDAMERSGRSRRQLANLLVAPSGDDAADAADADTDADDDSAPTRASAGMVWRGHRLAVTGLALTDDDATAYSVSKEGTIIQWDIETGAKIKFPRIPDVVVDPTKGGGGPMAPPRCGAATLLCCAVSPERHLLCTAGTDKRIHVYDTRSMKQVQEFASHRGSVTSLCIRKGTGQMFSVSTDRTLKVWSLDDMAYVDTLFGHQSEVMAVAPQRKERVVTVGRDRTCRFWKVAEDSQLIFRPNPGAGQLECCAFTSPDTWVTGSDDGTVSLWSTTKKRAVMSWGGVHGFGGLEGSAHGITAPKFSTPDELDAAVASRAATQEHCGVSAAAVAAPEGVSNAGRWVNSIAVAQGTDLCASGGGDGAIRLWRVNEDAGRQLMPLFCLPARGFVNALALASSGRFLLAGMGQEPRMGRWARDASAKNGLVLHRLNFSEN